MLSVVLVNLSLDHLGDGAPSAQLQITSLGTVAADPPKGSAAIQRDKRDGLVGTSWAERGEVQSSGPRRNKPRHPDVLESSVVETELMVLGDTWWTARH